MNTECDEYSTLKQDLQIIKLKLEKIQVSIDKIDKKQEQTSKEIWGKNGFNQRITALESRLSANLKWSKLAITSIISIIAGIIIGVFV